MQKWQEGMELDGERPVRSRQKHIPARSCQFRQEGELVLIVSNVLEYRAAEADIEVSVLEWQWAVRSNLHNARPGKDLLEMRAILDRGDCYIATVRIPQFQKVRLGERCIGCSAEIQNAPPWLGAGKRDEAFIHLASSPQRYA
jgi:hypothetical protein